MVEYAIECEGLTKKFGKFTAVDSINLRIKKGELFGFLGPNGAGKTTTIRMLTTLLTPTAGTATVATFHLRDQAALVRSKIGVVPQEFALFGELSPTENLWYIGELYGMKKKEIEDKSEELLKIVELYDKKDVPAAGFSGGMKQRLSVAAGLLHTPQILFMDEPTTGLDPQSRIALRELTVSLNDSGITIIYTTHDMEEADKLCDRIAIMDHGKIKAEGTSAELKMTYGGEHMIELEIEGYDKRLLDEIKALLKASDLRVVDRKIEIDVKTVSGGVLHELSNFLAKKKVEVLELRGIEPTLEDVFINLTAKALRD